jgi:hypothetical protein
VNRNKRQQRKKDKRVKDKRGKERQPVVMKESPLDIATAMRKEAKRNVGNDPIFRVYRGWNLGLSYGILPTPSRETWEHFKDDLTKRMGLKTKPHTYEEMLAAVEAGKLRGATDPHAYEWIFSASLYPRGRSSTEEDWHLYGELMACMGAPEGSLVTPLETTKPTDVHYCIWRDDPSAS